MPGWSRWCWKSKHALANSAARLASRRSGSRSTTCAVPVAEPRKLSLRGATSWSWLRWKWRIMSQVPLGRKVLSENDRIAAELRRRFADQGVLCLNLISSPGSGKTTLLERTLEAFPPSTRVAVLTGDIQTENDAARLRRFGFPVRQITTGGTCHLDARMIERALADWRSVSCDLLFIENVGNLVCPASYDLGEAAKVVVLSVTEGEDKPLKYPAIFFRSELLVLSKVDLLPYVPFDLEIAVENARRIHPAMDIVKVSSLKRRGLHEWFLWLEKRRHDFLQSANAMVTEVSS